MHNHLAHLVLGPEAEMPMRKFDIEIPWILCASSVANPYAYPAAPAQFAADWLEIPLSTDSM
jgi:hypothetical protein